MPWFENANFKFYHVLIPKSSNNGKNTQVKMTQTEQRLEKNVLQGLVVNFEHVMYSCIRPIKNLINLLKTYLGYNTNNCPQLCQTSKNVVSLHAGFYCILCPE